MSASAERSSTDLIRLWFAEVWNNRRVDMIDEVVAENWRSHGLPVATLAEMSARDAFRSLQQSYLAAFPDITFTVSQIHGEGDMASAHCVVTGTHTGDGLGFPATGRAINVTGNVMVRCQNGRVAESWESWNIHEMHAQLGLVTVPSSEMA
jgi:steroid delta-isomerase-like uncharacterized protein